MTPKQNLGAGKKRLPIIPLDHYQKQHNLRRTSLFFVFYNGKVTEHNYFQQLGEDIVRDSVTRSRFLRLRFAQGSPQQVVADAMRRIEERSDGANSEDIVWVVFDKDDFENYSDVIQSAIAEKMQVAYSNECFELWLLLHFQDVTQTISRGQLAKLLRSKWEELGNTVIDSPSRVKDFPYGLLKKHGSLKEATVRAKRLYAKAVELDSGHPWNCNPVTTVHDLVANLRKNFSESQIG